MFGFIIAMVLVFASVGPIDPAPAVVPSPAATATPANLPFIGRTRSKRYCDLETDRVNGAVTVDLLNDKIISSGIVRLRAADLDRSTLTILDREKVMRDLRAISAAIQKNLVAGNAQLTDMRQLSVKEPDATRSPELKLLADDLDDALTRQRTVGRDLAKMLTIVDGRYARAQGELEAAGVMPESQQSRVTNGIESIDQRAAYEPLNALFNDVADDFGDRLAAIGKAEDAAATHAPKALAGC